MLIVNLVRFKITMATEPFLPLSCFCQVFFVVIKCPDKGNLQEKWFIVTYNQGKTHHGGEVKAASHTAPTSRSRDERNAKAHPLSPFIQTRIVLKEQRYHSEAGSS